MGPILFRLFIYQSYFVPTFYLSILFCLDFLSIHPILFRLSIYPSYFVPTFYLAILFCSDLLSIYYIYFVPTFYIFILFCSDFLSIHYISFVPTFYLFILFCSDFLIAIQFLSNCLIICSILFWLSIYLFYFVQTFYLSIKWNVYNIRIPRYNKLSLFLWFPAYLSYLNSKHRIKGNTKKFWNCTNLFHHFILQGQLSCFYLCIHLSISW